MSVVKINVLQVPEGRGEVLEQRFAARAGEVDKVDGFESFDLLRPTEGTDRYLVVTKWRDEASFQAWMSSEAFGRGHGGDQQGSQASEQPGEHVGHHAGHAQGHPGGHDSGTQGHPSGSEGGHGSGHPGGAPQGGPAATGSELWGFEVVTSATGQRP